MRVFKTEIKTGGSGLWSDVPATVRVTHLDIDAESPEEDYAELRVYFTRKSWDVNKYGLIYTDPRWLEELRSDLIQRGFTPMAVEDVDYSEQGMQGTDFVSLDVGRKFVQEWFSEEVDSEDE